MLKTLSVNYAPPLGFTRIRFPNRYCISKCLIDSGNLFNDIISLELAQYLNLKYRPTSKRAGTANKDAKCDIIGRIKTPIKICLENIQWEGKSWMKTCLSEIPSKKS